MSASSIDLQDRVGRWRERKVVESGWMQPNKTAVLAKLSEEVGEFARAVVGEIEDRPDRGDPTQEAAQVIVVLFSYFGIHEPGVDLYAAVEAEMERLGA